MDKAQVYYDVKGRSVIALLSESWDVATTVCNDGKADRLQGQS